MSFRLRLTVFYAAILTGFFLCFGGFSYFVARQTLLGALDQHLDETTLRVINSTNAFRTGDITLLKFPDDMGVFQTATMFMMAVDTQGNVLTRSPNLQGFSGKLDNRPPSGIEPTYKSVTHSGQRLRVLTYPLLVDNETGEGTEILGYLQMAELMDNYYNALDQLGAILMITGGVVFLFFLFLGTRTTSSVLRPLAEITSVAVQITRADDLSRRLPDTGRHDEIGRLTMALNQTFERIEKLFRAQQRLLADVSHELRTPLTTIRGNIDLMRRIGEADTESLDIIQDELERMTRLVGDLLLLARADGGSSPIRWQTLELDTQLLDVYRQVQPLAEASEVTVHLKEITPVRMEGDGDKIKQLILILVDNAIKYSHEGGLVTLSLTRENAHALLRISDTGVGIAPEHLPHIFDRFYRVDKARTRALGGSGLGLSIAKWVTEAHHGTIIVESESGKGSTFLVRLPALPDGFESDEERQTAAPVPRTRRIPFPNLRS